MPSLYCAASDRGSRNGRELVQKNDRRSLARFFEIDADLLPGDGVGH
jgi:hypothetical protein